MEYFKEENYYFKKELIIESGELEDFEKKEYIVLDSENLPLIKEKLEVEDEFDVKNILKISYFLSQKWNYIIQIDNYKHYEYDYILFLV